MELWVFADASMAAIAACAYLQNAETKVISSLISGKTRLAPKKTKETIPRLEIVGILMALHLGTTISDASEAQVLKINIASDSEIAFCWVKNAKKLPIFVENQQNRIKLLKSDLNSKGIEVMFYHVATEFNPTDTGTRGINPRSIDTIDWIRGPQWLQTKNKLPQLRPLSEVRENDEISDESAQPAVRTVNPVINETDENETLFIEFSRFSKWTTALRTVSRVGKLAHKWVNVVNNQRDTQIRIQNVSKFSTDQNITSEDVKHSEIILLSQQHKHLSLSDLQKRFPHKQVVRDENGVIRYQSRLQNANLCYDTKCPIFIDNASDLARLILLDIHRKNSHCGKNQTLYIARQRFWIQRPSAAYNKYLKNCVICKRNHGLPFAAPNMAPLPSDRVKISNPFENVGCDFMGPVLSENQERMYVCLYTCLTTRVIHLEIVENLSTGAFLNCLIRFVSRRGVPKIIRTDCGTNFKLGKQIIDSMFETDNMTGSSVMSYSADAGINWIFNPPGAPWMGGAWERLVGTVKRSLQKSIGRKRPTFHQLTRP
ncbi:hypothetical protein OESDEN_03473 [Oesophagostomum dentatum]|uniref:Integrase catalytic domain-containing protein n=1 Tax=Oesophagostomum dentatum TaxID=61180 RepID=A0A0B1TH37_OESDE|nr:hypothetical protein OESDEN_03473 [Oesophagostomum dentatum]